MSLNKNEDFIKLPLDEILKMNGYFEKKDKSSQKYKVLTNEQNDLVIISKQSNGHYLYFNPNDRDRDSGNIFNFCKNRGIRATELIRENKSELEIKAQQLTPLDNSNNKKVLDEYKEMQGTSFSNFFFKKRLIDPYLIQEFSALKQDKYFNISSPSFALSKTTIQDKEYSQLTQQGYVCYLSKPLVDKETQKEINVKSLCKGTKGLEILRNNESKKEDIKAIIITESMIDSLSLLELKEFRTNECLVCSTNGQISKTQKEVFEYLDKQFSNAEVFLGFDNDKKGQELAKITKESFKNKEAKILKPNFKDFNDDLFLAKSLGLENNFSKDDCQRVINNFESKNEKFMKDFHNLNDDELIKQLKQITNENLPKYESIKLKVENYIDTDKLENSYAKLHQFLARETSKEQERKL